jgi:hypothetical protein
MLCITCDKQIEQNSHTCAFCGAANRSPADNSSEVIALCSAYREYAKARAKLLSFLPRVESCRDPLCEFSEVLVAKLLNANRAASPVQKGYDLVRPNNRTVQVKYLANPRGSWKNFHTIRFTNDHDEYALVFFVGLHLQAVIVFTRGSIQSACELLSKRHPNQMTTLQIYQRDFEQLLSRRADFEALGISIFEFRA